MSHTIEYGRKAFYLPKGTNIPEGFGQSAHELWENEIFLFIQSGCNNVYPRPRSWHLTASGWNYTVIREVCERAGSTEGGCIQFVSGWTTPENYIKMYRKVIAEAELLTVEALRKWGLDSVDLMLGTKQPDKYEQSMVEDFKASPLVSYRGKWLNTYDRYNLPLRDFDSFHLLWYRKGCAEYTGGCIAYNHSGNK